MKQFALPVALSLIAALLAPACASGPEREGVSSYESAPSYAIATKGPKRRVAITKFKDKTAYGQGRLGSAMVDILSTELVKTDAFIMVERTELGDVLAEQALGQSGAVKAETAAKAGGLLGAQYIITGAVSKFGEKSEGENYGVYKSKVQRAECTVDVRLIDATTGQIIMADSGDGVFEKEITQVLGLGGRAGYDETMSQNALRAAVSKLMSNLVTKMTSQPWRGKIAQVKSDMIYINAGQKTGLQVGDTLTVQELGEEIIDPDTGVSMGRAPGKIKGKLTVQSFFGEDGSVARKVSGGGFAKGDQVELSQ